MSKKTTAAVNSVRRYRGITIFSQLVAMSTIEKTRHIDLLGVAPSYKFSKPIVHLHTTIAWL